MSDRDYIDALAAAYPQWRFARELYRAVHGDSGYRYGAHTVAAAIRRFYPDTSVSRGYQREPVLMETCYPSTAGPTKYRLTPAGLKAARELAWR